MTLAIRTATQPESMTAVITRTVEALDPEQPVRNVQTMQDLVDQSISNRRMSMVLLTVFAGLALILTAFGLYSVLAYTVRHRLREIGIRMALGASVPDVLRIVAIESLRPTLAGIVAGIAGALGISTLLTKLIFGIRPTDPATYAIAAILLTIVAMVASVIPAWRATRVDPLQVLRDE